MTALTLPDVRRHAALAAMIAEYTEDVAHGSGLWNLAPSDQPPLDEAGVRRFVRLLSFLADPAATFLDDTVPSWYFWVTDDVGELVGFLAFRHRLNDWLLAEGGHIGYSVRPSRRREGHASGALALAVGRARELGLDRVLVTCDVDNLGSAATIRACGGVQEDVRAGRRRFWITTLVREPGVGQIGSPGR